MRKFVLTCVTMVLIVGLTGCAKSSDKADPNATPTKKKTAKDMPQPQERYGFAPLQ